jgi:hypothetical protein
LSGSSKPGEEISNEKSLFGEKATFFYLPVQATIILSQFVNADPAIGIYQNLYVIPGPDLYFNQEVFRVRVRLMPLPFAQWPVFANQYSLRKMKKGTVSFPSIVFCHRKGKGNQFYNPNLKRQFAG